MERLEIGLCWGTLQRAGLLELIERAGRHGFPTLSVRPDDVLAALDAGLDATALRRCLRDAGVRVRVIDAISGALPGQPPPSNEETCYRMAEAAEAPIVNLTHYGGGPVARPEIVDAIGNVCRRARSRGFQIVLEFIPETGLPNLRETLDVVRAAGESNCALLLDTWHLARSGGTLEDVRRLPPGTIGAVQLSDRTPPPPGAPYVPMSGRDLPGEGQLPLCELVRAALANNRRVTAEVEVFSDELRSMSVEAAAARVAAAVKTWRTSCDDSAL
jgi:sugar phosphate isomerase/epimerase